MPANRERPNRGGKPLLSVGIDGGSALLGVFAPAHVVPKRRSDAGHYMPRSESVDE
jgi:hypothetical protein